MGQPFVFPQHDLFCKQNLSQQLIIGKMCCFIMLVLVFKVCSNFPIFIFKCILKQQSLAMPEFLEKYLRFILNLNDLIIDSLSPRLHSYIEISERTEIKMLFYRIRYCIPLVYVTLLWFIHTFISLFTRRFIHSLEMHKAIY